MADAADCQCDHKPDGRYPSAAESRNFSCTAPLQGKRLSVYPVFPSDENRKLPGTFREIFTAGGTLYLESLSLRWQKAAGRIAERIRG